MNSPEYEAQQISHDRQKNGRFVSFRVPQCPRSEGELREKLFTSLGEFFHVHTEVWGTSLRTGARLRMDAVLRPRNPATWWDADPMFGVECKSIDYERHESLNKFTSWAAQAVDYAYTEWDEYGRLTIVTCPAITGECSYLDDKNMFFMSRLLGQFNVGELGRIPGKGWVLRLSGENYWTQHGGIGPIKRSLIPKEGSGR